MLIFSQDRKTVMDCVCVSVTRNFGGKKDGKYALVGTAGYGTEITNGILGAFAEEKNAVDELEKIFAAFADGAKAYKID